jgi:hypothetical protein
MKMHTGTAAAARIFRIMLRFKLSINETYIAPILYNFSLRYAKLNEIFFVWEVINSVKSVFAVVTKTQT